MRAAIALAISGMERGDGGPFGAVVVRDGRIVGRGWNRVLVDHDPTAHAEIVALRAACRRLGTHVLSGCEIFASCDPCPMCLAAIHWARVDRIWYAAPSRAAAAAGFDDTRFKRELRLPPGKRRLPARRILSAEGAEPFRRWAKMSTRTLY
ncbi:MAG: nucleoside deaminase [Alphaproteobacteria bacterium]|nr:nucleoside deaminase [Alphaproteobacteria bacterium]